MQEILNALTWTFIHSLWQGLIVALMAAVIISATLKTSPTLRYNLLCILLISLPIAVCTTFALQLEGSLEKNELVRQITANKLVGNATKIPTYTNIAQDIAEWVDENSTLLLIIWTIFFSFNAIKLGMGFVKIDRLKSNQVHPLPALWQAKLASLKNVLGIQQSVTLLQSELISIPVALGILKPVILLPIGLIAKLPVEQVEAILLHELAHIKRKDYFVNILQHVTETIFFFNPGVMWISSLIRREREACCDEIVVTRLQQKHHYLEALVSFEEYSSQQVSFALSLGNQPHQLMARVKRMVTHENKGLGFAEKLVLFSALLMCSAFGYVSQKEHFDKLSTHETILDNTLARPSAPLKEEKKFFAPLAQREKKVHLLSKPNPRNIKIVSLDSIQAVAQRQLSALLLNSAVTDLTHLSKNSEYDAAYEEEVSDETAAQALQNIIKLKEEIGEVKAVIEVLKSKFTQSSEKTQIMQDLDRERKKLSGMRLELEKLRARYEKLKKEEAANPSKK